MIMEDTAPRKELTDIISLNGHVIKFFYKYISIQIFVLFSTLIREALYSYCCVFYLFFVHGVGKM